MKKKNCAEILEYIIIFLSIAGICFTAYLAQNVISYDDLWLYHMSLKMLNGYMPYKEINMIVTPLFFQIVEVFMKLFGDGAIIYYICSSVLSGIFAITMYALLNKINKSKVVNLCIMMLFAFASAYLTLFQYSYNIMVVGFIFLVMLFELKKQEKGGRVYDYLIGLMLGFAAASKQTIGGLAIVFSLLYDLYKRFHLKKVEEKGSVLRKVLGILSVALPYLIWLLLNDSLMSFLDQCIFAIFEFGQKNQTGYFFNYYTLAYIIFVGISIYLSFNKKYRKLQGYEKMNMLTFYEVPMLFIIIPLINQYHLVLMVCALIPLISFYISLFFENKLLKISNATWIPLLMFIGYTFIFCRLFYRHLELRRYEQ